ncbi:hypothetical protein D3C72_1955090 [compost metagenome]
MMTSPFAFMMNLESPHSMTNSSPTAIFLNFPTLSSDVWPTFVTLLTPICSARATPTLSDLNVLTIVFMMPGSGNNPEAS